MSLKRDSSPHLTSQAGRCSCSFSPSEVTWSVTTPHWPFFNNHSTFSSLETFLWPQRKLRCSTDSVCARVWVRGPTEARRTNKQCRLVAKGHVIPPKSTTTTDFSCFLAGAEEHTKEVNTFLVSCSSWFLRSKSSWGLLFPSSLTLSPLEPECLEWHREWHDGQRNQNKWL